jgi:hypothetical protein
MIKTFSALCAGVRGWSRINEKKSEKWKRSEKIQVILCCSCELIVRCSIAELAFAYFADKNERKFLNLKDFQILISSCCSAHVETTVCGREILNANHEINA